MTDVVKHIIISVKIVSDYNAWTNCGPWGVFMQPANDLTQLRQSVWSQV